jgi:chromate reductase, NAD(P)H dehydrogenase (quinone)
MNILAISGSLRRDSHNRALLRAAAELPPGDAHLELFERLRDVPPYDQDDDRDPAPAPVEGLRAAIADADAVLFATPEYNSSIPGQLKNALDWASRPLGASVLTNKPVAVVGASTGAFGAVWSQAELRKVLAAAGARVLDAELSVPHAHERFDEVGRLTDEHIRDRLSEILEQLIASASPVASAAPPSTPRPPASAASVPTAA